MRRILSGKTRIPVLILLTFFVSFNLHAQNDKLIGAWISRDSLIVTYTLIKKDGKIEERRAVTFNELWNQDPRTGKYILTSKNLLIIKWSDQRIENRQLRFLNDFKALELQMPTGSDKNKLKRVFVKIVDEEVVE